MERLTNGFMRDDKFHPIKPYTKKGVTRKKREPFPVTTDGVKLDQRKLIQMQRADVGRRSLDISMSDMKIKEWEHVVGSRIVNVKNEMIDGMPVTTVIFANGEEWFEFDKISHQDSFMMENKLDKIEEEIGKFVEVNHPIIAGFITMKSGKVLFEEKRKASKEYKTVYPYKGRNDLAKLKFKDLPDELQDDLNDTNVTPDGRPIYRDIEEGWNEMSTREKLEYIEEIRDDYGN